MATLEPHYRIGCRYRMLNGQTTKIVGVANAGTGYETVYDNRGCHRYSRRDFGRVTGTRSDPPYPLNIPKDAVPVPPKQWNHWCRKAGLEAHYKQHGPWRYMKGHGRYWRLNDKSVFECGDTYEEFDRWALCTRTQILMPITEAEFMAAVEYLLAEHRRYDDSIFLRMNEIHGGVW